MNKVNKSRGPQKIKSTRIVAIAVILAIVGYQWYQNNRNAAPPTPIDQGTVAKRDAGSAEASADKYRVKQFEPKPNSQQPASDGLKDSNSTANEFSTSETSSKAKSDSQVSSTRSSSTPGSATETNGRSNNGSNQASSYAGETKSDSFLQPAGGRNLKSPAGLIYGMGPDGEHRVDHVMRHARDDLARPSHGVFDGDQQAILQTIDDAYELIKSKSKYVKTEPSQGNTAYSVSLGRRIGYEGGEKGQRSNNKPLKSIRLILDGDRVITAYPYR
jgi:hypothetical protein